MSGSTAGRVAPCTCDMGSNRPGSLGKDTVIFLSFRFLVVFLHLRFSGVWGFFNKDLLIHLYMG